MKARTIAGAAAATVAAAVLAATPAHPALSVRLNPALTPGVTVPGVTAAQVCTPGYATRARPSAAESARLKRDAMARYGITGARPGAYQGDHLISLELAGAPRDPENWWPEPTAQAHRKDKVENLLHEAVCSGRVPLAVAQQCEASHWELCTKELGL